MKTIKQLILSMSLLLTGLVSYGQQSTISVEVTNIQSEDGTILIGLFDSEKNFLKTRFKSQRFKAKEGDKKVSFDDIPAGTYTISIIHDENDNGSLDMNFMGIPSEPYGISKNGKSMFGPPSYQKAKFEVTDKNVDLKISL